MRGNEGVRQTDDKDLPSNAVLDVEDVSVSYGGILALRNVSLQLGQGEIVALVGANGAGKSSLLWSIVGVVPHHTGSVRFKGALLNVAPFDIARKGIALVPERRRLFPGLSVWENMLMGAWQQRDSAKISQSAEGCFALFPVLKERINQRAGTLSGGEQQMLALARALMSQPEVLLLDEPSLGLAPIVIEQVFEAVVRLQEEGLSILLVEQNSHQALAISNRGYVLDNGHVTLEGPAKDLASNEQVQKAYLG